MFPGLDSDMESQANNIPIFTFVHFGQLPLYAVFTSSIDSDFPDTSCLGSN